MALLAQLAENDNAQSETRDPRARAALLSPLKKRGEAPSAACRKFHTVGGDRVLASTMAVEQIGGTARWRVSVALWGRSTAERRDVASLLAQHLALAVGQGPLEIEVGPSTWFVRRALTMAERTLMRGTALAIAT
ncbi:MAG: hypothetical protein ACXVEF_02970 [Polyangiales bacterium]